MYTASKDDNVAGLKNSNFRDKADAVKSELSDAKSDLRDVANEAGHKVRHFINTASDQINHASDTVTTQIRSNPVQSTAIALGVGFLVGVLFRR